MGKNRGLKEIAEQQIKTIHVSFTLREITLLGLSNGPDDSEAPHVNLKYYDPRHECFSCWEPNELGGFSSFCVKLTQMKWAEIYKSGGQVGHKTGLGYTIHKDLSKLPNNPALGDLSSASAVGRFEHHGSHPGLHAHGDCQRSGIELGPSSLNNLPRFPKTGPDSYHRRNNAWTKEGFWEAAKRFFRVREKKGSLI